MAVSVTALSAGAANAADVEFNKDFMYTCNVVAAGLPLGDKNVGVNAQVVMPDEVTAGDTVPERQTAITLTLPEDLRAATYGLLNARQASGFSDDSSIKITADGVDDMVIPINNLAADWSEVPATADPPWKIPTVGDVPAIPVPTPPSAPVTATIHMPAAFNVTASLLNAAGESVGGEGAVSMACTIQGADDVFGTFTINPAAPANNAPTANDVSVSTDYGTAVDVALEGADEDGDELTYSYDQPANGTVSGEGANVTYTPAAGFSGEDTFTYTVSDGQETASATVTVSVAEQPNTPPTAGDLSVTTEQDTAIDVTLAGQDADGDELTYSYDQPANGTVSGEGANVTYTPAAGFSGEDSFTYTVSDGEAEATGTVSVTVQEVVPPNTAPTAGDVAAETDEGVAVDIALDGADADGDELTYTYGTPANGAVSGEGASVTYMPAEGFAGTDSFTYTVSDGQDEATGTVTVTVNEVVEPPVNTPPTAGDVTAETDEGVAVDIALDGADADGDELTYTYGTPANGAVSGEGANVTYTPAEGFAGTDSFTYTVSDGQDEATGTVTVTVNEVVDPPTNTAPTAGDVAAETDENMAVDITLDGADADGDELTYSYEQPANGTVSGDGATVSYTPNDGFFGEDSFTYTVSDGQETASATVTVTVNEVVDPPTNTPPTAGDVTATTDFETAVDIALNGADADGDELAYSYTQPANGTVSGEGANVTYTPEAGFSGTDTFTYTVDDGNGGTATADVTVTVNADDTPPPVDKCGPMPNPLKQPFAWLKWLACKIIGAIKH